MSRDKNKQHEYLCVALHEMYARKNHDYGDSFGESVQEWGIIAALTRMSDKWNRIKQLVKNNGEHQVHNEGLEDSLLDLANYALMTYMEIHTDSKEIKEEEIKSTDEKS